MGYFPFFFFCSMDGRIRFFDSSPANSSCAFFFVNCIAFAQEGQASFFRSGPCGYGTLPFFPFLFPSDVVEFCDWGGGAFCGGGGVGVFGYGPNRASGGKGRQGVHFFFFFFFSFDKVSSVRHYNRKSSPLFFQRDSASGSGKSLPDVFSLFFLKELVTWTRRFDVALPPFPPVPLPSGLFPGGTIAE